MIVQFSQVLSAILIEFLHSIYLKFLSTLKIKQEIFALVFL